MERVQFRDNKDGTHTMRVRVAQNPDHFTHYNYVNHRPKNVQKSHGVNCYFVRDSRQVVRSFSFGKSLTDGELYAWPHTSVRFHKDNFVTRGTKNRPSDVHVTWKRLIRGYPYSFTKLTWGDSGITTITAYRGDSTQIVWECKFPAAE